MKRDFSEEALETLTKQISQIEDSDWTALTDFFGDLGYDILECVGFLDIEDHIGKIDKYHKKVLDQHDTTVKRLKAIFQNVADADSDMAGKFQELAGAYEEIAARLNALADLIGPGGAPLTSQGVNKVQSDFNKNFTVIEKSLNESFGAELSYQEKKAMENVKKDLKKDILSLAVNVASLGANIASGNIAGIVADGYEVINSLVETAQDISAYSDASASYNMGKDGVDDIEECLKRMELVEQAQTDQQKEGLIDAVENAPAPLKAAVQVAGAAAAIYGIYQIGKGVVDNAEKVGKYVTDGRFNTLDRMTELTLKETTGVKVKISNTGVKTGNAKKIFDFTAGAGSDIPDHIRALKESGDVSRYKKALDAYRKWSERKSILSNTKAVYNMTNAVIEGDGIGTAVKNTSIVKFYNRLDGFLEDAESGKWDEGIGRMVQIVTDKTRVCAVI